MIKKSRLCVIVTALIFSVGILAGCAETNEETIPDSEDYTSTEEDTEKKVYYNVVNLEEFMAQQEAVDESDLDELEEDKPSWDEPSDVVVFPEGTNMISFSGKRNIPYKSDDYGAYEGEKYILLVDKNMELPGDYNLMLDDIVDAVEKASGLSIKASKSNFSSNMIETYEKETPWEGLKSAGKLIIQLNNSDSDPYIFYSPEYFAGYVVFENKGIYTYSNSEVSDSDFDDLLCAISSELFYKQYPDLTLEGAADAIIRRSTLLVEKKYPDFKRIHRLDPYASIRRDISPDDAMNLWININRNGWSWEAKEAYTSLFIEFMLEKTDNEFLSKFLTDNYDDESLSRADMAARITNLYGDDIFKEYIAWINNGDYDIPERLNITVAPTEFVFADKNYYIEGEKCFIYIEKGIYVPGDVVTVCDTIVKELEKEMWGDRKIAYKESGYLNLGPFAALSNKGKLAIFLELDENNMGSISSASEEGTYIYDYGMRVGKRGDVDYRTIAHECSHIVMGAVTEYSKIGRIMTEGTAEYYSDCVISKMMDVPRNDLLLQYDYSVPINAGTAEELFVNDFKEVSHVDRGPEYYYGKYLSEYLHETFGESFLTTYSNAIEKSAIKESGAYGDDSDREIRTQVFKECFGDDIFTKFGEWYSNNMQ